MEQLFSNNYLDSLRRRTPEKGIHTYTHQIVKEICEYFKAPKEFGRWLGVAKRIGIHQLKAKFDEVKGRGITNIRYLSACCKSK